MFVLLPAALSLGVAVRAQDGGDEEFMPGWREFVEPVLAGGGVGRAFFPAVYAGPRARPRAPGRAGRTSPRTRDRRIAPG